MIYEKEFPKKKIQIEGTSSYAAAVELGSLGHLSKVFEVLFESKDGAVCLDVGANIGLTSLLMDQTFEGSKIVAYEPHPSTYEQLRINIDANKTGLNTIETFNFGLGDAEGELLFRDVDQYNTGNSLLIEGSLGAAAQNSTTVKVKTLDSISHDVGHIDLMKIDVEGFELDVLKGASKTLNSVDAVLIEFNHWCLSSLAHVLPVDALKTICELFEGVFVYDLQKKTYKRIESDQEKWSFLHKNMVNFNVNDLLCTNSKTTLDRVLTSLE